MNKSEEQRLPQESQSPAPPADHGSEGQSIMTSPGQDAATEMQQADQEKRGPRLPEIPEELPILPLRGLVIYPMTTLPLTVGVPRLVRLVDDAVVGKRIIGLVAIKSKEIEELTPDDVYRVGLSLIHI